VGLEECESDGDASPTRRMAEAVSTRQRASRTAEGVSNTPSSVLYTADGVLGTGKWKIRKRKRNTSHDETKPRGESDKDTRVTSGRPRASHTPDVERTWNI